MSEITESINSSVRDDRERILELENMNKMLNIFIDNSEVGMYIIDLFSGEVLYANRKMAEMSGVLIPPQEFIGKKCWEFISHESDKRCSFCPYKKLIDSDNKPIGPYIWENYLDKLGIWLKIISQAIVLTDGRLAQMNTFYDITETKKMQEQIASFARESEHRRMQQNLQEVLDTLPIPVRIATRDTAEIQYANNACLKMFDYPTPESMMGLFLSDMVPVLQSDGEESQKKLDTLLRANDSLRLELEYVTSKGVIIDGHVTVCGIKFNGKSCMLSIITDLSAEREQRRMLQNAAEKERAANRLKSNFLSNMSHEVRTPMNAVIGLTEIELRKKNSKETLEVYKKINLSAKSLLQIVNDILDMSKIEANKLEIYPDEFELEEVLNNALLVVSPRLEGKKVEMLPNISLDLPRYLIGDKTRLWQVLKNYLDNAAKFTKEGYILLTVTEDKKLSTEETIYITFVIEDTGIGMNNEQLRKAFLPYEQVYSEAQKRYTGTGLGLPLSKRICELMGGDMKLASTQGQGTTICFTLPFRRSQKSETIMRIPDLSGFKILAVDDSELALRIMCELLAGSGAVSFSARSCADALKIVRKQKPDVILLDYIMEGKNGLETATELRKIIPESTKLLMVTAYGSQLIYDEVISYGIYDLIEKPFVPSLFFNKLMTALNYSCSQQDSVEDCFTIFENVRVLVCEDNEINRMVASGMLEQFGITPVFAENGQLGIETLYNSEPFDLILMDVHMPVMDGYETARKIRADARFADVPIVSLTADAMTQVIDQCLTSGMNDYLSKPFGMNDFHDMLLKWLPKSKHVKSD